jgi:prophage regulatory protein
MAHNFTAPVTGALILERLPNVKARTGLSRSEIYRRIASNPPTFPAPVKLGERASAWNAAEVDSWITARIAARDAKAAAA